MTAKGENIVLRYPEIGPGMGKVDEADKADVTMSFAAGK